MIASWRCTWWECGSTGQALMPATQDGNSICRLISFQRERYWFSASADAASASVRGRPTGDPLLGSRLHCTAEKTGSTKRAFVPLSPAFIAHHRVLDRVVLPATAYLDMLLAAAREHVPVRYRLHRRCDNRGSHAARGRRRSQSSADGL